LIDNILNHKLVAVILVLTGAYFTANFIISGSKIFILPFLCIGYFVWWRFAFQYKLSALIVLICFNESLYKLVSLGMAQRKIGDITLVLMASLIFPHIFKVTKTMGQEWEHYGKYIAFFIFIVLLSLFAGSYLVFGQPLTAGIFPARKYFFILSYFYMIAIGFQLSDFEKIFNYIAISGAVIAVLVLIDVQILGGGVLFNFEVSTAKTRFSSIRFSVSTSLVVVACIYSFIKSRNVSDFRQQYFYLGICFVCFLEIVTCNMTRARIIGLVFVLAVIYMKKINFARLIALILLFISVVFAGEILGTLPILNRLTKLYTLTVSEVQTRNPGQGNINIRARAFEHYTRLWITKSPIFGLGVFSETKYPRNPVTYAELKHHYFISDIKAMGTFIRFGIPGLALVIALYFKLFHDIKHLWNKVNDEEMVILSTIFYQLIYTLLTPTLGSILTSELVYYGIFFYYISLLYQKYSGETQTETETVAEAEQ